MDDRRKHQRFRLAESCIIDHSRVVGTIADISMGGLSCICLNMEHCRQQEAPHLVTIYCGKGNLRIDDVKIHVLESLNIPGKFAEHFGVRKCRVRFEQLQDVQISLLEEIILNAALPDSLSPSAGKTP